MGRDLSSLLAFLEKLDSASIHYTLENPRCEAIMVRVHVPGEQWEIEFFSDGSVEVERFLSDGTILDEAALGELFGRFSD